LKIAVVGNGEWNIEWGRKQLALVDQLICADGGANSALMSERYPDLAIGDFDSLTPENYQRLKQAGVKLIQYPREKDQTDLELALEYAKTEALKYGEQDIWLYGATGRRHDHFLGNVGLLLAYARQGLRVRMLDPDQEMWVVQGTESISGAPGQQISLLSLTDRALVSTEGLYYPLRSEFLHQDSPRGISNVLLSTEATIQVQEGWVLVLLNVVE